MAFLKDHVQVRIGNIEWPAYLDIVEQTKTNFEVVPFTKENGFHPNNATYFDRAGLNPETRLMPVISNPQNPSGQTRSGEELRELIQMAEQPGNGILLDEAYEMFHSPSVSAIEYVQDLDNSNVFIAAACTKGLQSPGVRIGWIIASKKNIETMANYSSFGMGGVSHPSQHYAETRVVGHRLDVLLTGDNPTDANSRGLQALRAGRCDEHVAVIQVLHVLDCTNGRGMKHFVCFIQ
jgi:aspartate/methionine/tyrosine aminotransferase